MRKYPLLISSIAMIVISGIGLMNEILRVIFRGFGYLVDYLGLVWTEEPPYYGTTEYLLQILLFYFFIFCIIASIIIIKSYNRLKKTKLHLMLSIVIIAMGIALIIVENIIVNIKIPLDYNGSARHIVWFAVLMLIPAIVNLITAIKNNRLLLNIHKQTINNPM